MGIGLCVNVCGRGALTAKSASNSANTCRPRNSLLGCVSRSLKESICLANDPSSTFVTAERALAGRVLKPSVFLRSSIVVSFSQTLLGQPKARPGLLEAATTASLTLSRHLR